MPVAYDPAKFWSICFECRGSLIPCVAPRAIAVFPFALAAWALEQHSGQLGNVEVNPSSYDLSEVLTPIVTVVGLLLAFRIHDAHGKWHEAAHLVTDLHNQARLVISLLVAYTPVNLSDEKLDEKLRLDLERIRRHLVLACVLIRKHVNPRRQGGKSFDIELEWGVITEAEVKLLTTTPLSVSKTSGKEDNFPSKNQTYC